MRTHGHSGKWKFETPIVNTRNISLQYAYKQTYKFATY